VTTQLQLINIIIIYVEALQLHIHCSCQLQDVPAGRGTCTDSSECMYGVGTESRDKIKNMGMGPVIDMKGLGV
jgi:hypothetical protein